MFDVAFGNKRFAVHLLMVFRRLHGVTFAPSRAQSSPIILGLAAGEVSEDSRACWIADNWPNG